MAIRRATPAIVLFFLSPLVAEFLLGDFTLAQLPNLIVLAPAYGGAAVLIRELTRRAGRGWPTILLLALAYGVIEEGLETQSLFNPGYLDAHLLDRGFVPALGISVPWTLFVLALHTVWSVSVPIALVEEWTTRRTEPWLRLPGLLTVAALATLGAATTFAFSYSDDHFLAHPAQLITAAVAGVALIVAAFRVPRRERPTPFTPTPRASVPPAEPTPAAGRAVARSAVGRSGEALSVEGSATAPAPPVVPFAEAPSVGRAASADGWSAGASSAGGLGEVAGPDEGSRPGASPVSASAAGAPRPSAPAPWLVLVVTLAAGALFLAGRALPPVPGVALLIVVFAGMAAALLLWSARPGWDGRHRLATTAGALLTYAWHSFLMHPVAAAPAALVVAGHIVFALAAVALLYFEARRTRAREGSLWTLRSRRPMSDKIT
jgi:hypothetical protein